MRCIVPQDLEARIKRWQGVVWWHHTIRKYKYVVFDDELCLVKEGAANGKTLVKGTGTQPKIFGEDEKGSVTVLLAGVADMETGIFKLVLSTRSEWRELQHLRAQRWDGLHNTPTLKRLFAMLGNLSKEVALKLHQIVKPRDRVSTTFWSYLCLLKKNC